MILEGRLLATQIRSSLAQRAAAVWQKLGRPICLCALGSSDDYAARLYLQKEIDAAEQLGIETHIFDLDPHTPPDGFLRALKELADYKATDAVLIPRPLPAQLADTPFADFLNPQQDIDGMSTGNLGRLFLCKTWEQVQALPGFVPCTAMAVMRLLEFHQVKLDGAAVTVIGRSSTVGRPLAHLLSCKNATVTLCHSHTDLPRAVKDADVVCTAAGCPGLLQTGWLKPGATVIDISTNWTDNHLCGDSDEKALAAGGFSYSPVPGGVGPVTLALLLENIILSGERRI
ncbi:MAG: bifunctional 5,10-methylenetetrahydrofolate dehydrogenase/5,10-methenyltetrahydrofolate cyclohydrolase [Elusimicrobiaceae bacterium]|nr:bifunctional 5,10-methylenetetrahydrofolate dehydrogenase/5,10-methenyltetrahydrofolate cyclohydrolase [Elusimicrobiaceae bacterium]